MLDSLERDLGRTLDGIATRLTSRGVMMSSAESCTGGLLAACLTARAGSSAWFDRGFVAYSDSSKPEMLGVSPETLQRHGSVSAAAVAEMARGAIAASCAGVAVAVSGIAGPGGGTLAKPVGLVCFAWYLGPEHADTAVNQLEGDRAAIRSRSVVIALEGLHARLEG